MEVLRKGSPNEWSVEAECTGKGNGGFGCNSLLKAVAGDLRYFEGTEYPVYRPNAVCMRCPECGKVTDLKHDLWPPRAHNLERFSTAWAKGEANVLQS